jgi:superfamily II DNA or RNA helicase
MKMFLVLLMRLRQISVHPQVYIQARKKAVGKLYKRADWTGGSAKVNTILDILRGDVGTQEAKESHGYIIFCNFREEIEILHERIAAEPSVYKVFNYHGSMSVAERTDCILKLEKAANAEKGHTILLAQIQCGGTGLNLQYLDRVIFTTPWWTAALMDQAAGRVLRLGQKKQVIIHSIALQEEESASLNIDDFIQTKVEIKRKMCLDALNAANNQLSYEEEEPIVTAAMAVPVANASLKPVKKFKMMPKHIAAEMCEMAVQLNKLWPCPVCFEDKPPTADMVLACGHKVCLDCREKFCKDSCPTCRD